MAFLKVLILGAVVVVAQVSAEAAAGYAGAGSFSGWPFNGMPMPQIPMFQMPMMPVIPPMKVLRPADIASMKAGPGQMVNGISVQSSSVLSTGSDGKVIREQSATILTNDGKIVKEYKVGDNPPDVREYIIPPVSAMDDPDFPEMDMHFPKMPEMKFKEIKMPKMPKIKVPKIPKVDPISTHHLRNHLPGKDENFIGYASSSFSSSSNVNGVKSSIGGSDIILNNNGKVDEEYVRHQKADKRKKNGEGKGYFKHSKVKPLKPTKPFKHAKPNPDNLWTHIPDKNEHFVALSTSSVSHSTIINGKITHAAASQTLFNNNGKVDEETVAMNSADTDDDVSVEDEE